LDKGVPLSPTNARMSSKTLCFAGKNQDSKCVSTVEKFYEQAVKIGIDTTLFVAKAFDQR
jgi:hypothetical protein